MRLAREGTLEAYPVLGDGDFLFSRQVNLETIHAHDVVAERYGTVSEVRGEAQAASLSRGAPSSANGSPRNGQPVPPLRPPRSGSVAELLGRAPRWRRGSMRSPKVVRLSARRFTQPFTQSLTVDQSVREERLDVGRAVGLVVEEVRVVDVERDQRRRVPDRIGVLRVADVVEETRPSSQS